MAVILVLDGIVFPVVHTPLGFTESGMTLDSHYLMCALVLLTGLSGGHSLWLQAYAFLTDITTLPFSRRQTTCECV